MYSRANYTVVGFFVLLFGIGAVVFAFWLAKYGFEQKYDYYKTYFTESVAGLSRDSVVYLHGVEVGRVKEIRIDPRHLDRVEVVLAIKEGIPITEDMKATTVMLGVTGLLSIELEGGAQGKPLVPGKEGALPVIPSRPSWFGETKHRVAETIAHLQSVLAKAETVLNETNRKHIDNILAHTDRITEEGVSIVSETNATLHTLQKSFDVLQKKFAEATGGLSDFATQSKPAIKNLMRAAHDFDRLTRKVEKSLDRGDYNLRKILEPMMTDIRVLSDTMGNAVERLGESPSDLLFKSRQQRKGPGE